MVWEWFGRVHVEAVGMFSLLEAAGRTAPSVRASGVRFSESFERKLSRGRLRVAP